MKTENPVIGYNSRIAQPMTLKMTIKSPHGLTTIAVVLVIVQRLLLR
jgi:hypothetical protein